MTETKHLRSLQEARTSPTAWSARKQLPDSTRRGERADSDQEERKATPSRVLGRQMAGIRSRRGLTAAQLAERCAGLGVPQIDRSLITKIENSVRGVSLDESITLAAALNIALVHLIAPMDDDNQEVWVTPTVAVPAAVFRAFVRGETPLPGEDDKPYRTEVPDSEWDSRNRKLLNAEREAASAQRRLRVAHAKVDLMLEEIARLAPSPFDLALGSQLGQTYRRVEARLDAAYDQIAEAKVDLEDAIARLELIREETETLNATRLPREEL